MMRKLFAVLMISQLLFSGCEEEPPPDCQALNVGVPVKITSEYPARLQFDYRVINIYRKEIDTSSGTFGFLGGDTKEYECTERALDAYFIIDENFSGTAMVEASTEIVSLLKVLDLDNRKELTIDISAKTSTNLFVKEEGVIIGTDLIN
jgi:hypothetical protein